MSNILINVYWICMLIGFIWLVIQVVLADFGHDFSGFDVDPGGIDVDIDGVHLDHVDVHGMGEVQLSPVSPMVISGFVTFFGVAGVVMNRVGMAGLHVPFLAVLIGLVGGAIIWLLLSWIIRVVSGTSEARIGELIGHEAEVITPIRGTGFGEIAYVTQGSRYNARAASLDKKDIDRASIVKIVKIVGTTYYVKEMTDEEIHGESRSPEGQ